ncbi:MAG: phosphotransferase [Legionellaceae bacterium]|nr:phosphotransferase [Legionellaceae bacterium]
MEHKKAIKWAETYLQDIGAQLQGSFAPVRVMPWSGVYCIATSIGSVYLKQTARPFAIEVMLFPYLINLFPEILPKMVGKNQDLRCFLMRDAGSPLRDCLCVNYQVELANKGLAAYVGIQQGVTNHVDALLELGVPDWRLAVLPSLYLKLLDEEAFLISDGLTRLEIDRLKKLHTRVSELCYQLNQYDIPETIEHGDFHDNNMLLNDGSQLIINDWGDTIITHPFFSMTSFLDSAFRHHKIDDTSSTGRNLLDSYLNHWVKYEPKARLIEAFELVKRLNNIKFVISFYRITQCPGMDGLGEYKRTIAKALIEFAEAEKKG